MLALRGICEGGKIELLDPVPGDLRSLVAVVFLDVEQEQVKVNIEAAIAYAARVIEHEEVFPLPMWGELVPA